MTDHDESRDSGGGVASAAGGDSAGALDYPPGFLARSFLPAVPTIFPGGAGPRPAAVGVEAWIDSDASHGWGASPERLCRLVFERLAERGVPTVPVAAPRAPGQGQQVLSQGQGQGQGQGQSGERLGYFPLARFVHVPGAPGGCVIIGGRDDEGRDDEGRDDEGRDDPPDDAYAVAAAAAGKGATAAAAALLPAGRPRLVAELRASYDPRVYEAPGAGGAADLWREEKMIYVLSLSLVGDVVASWPFPASGAADTAASGSSAAPGPEAAVSAPVSAPVTVPLWVQRVINANIYDDYSSSVPDEEPGGASAGEMMAGEMERDLLALVDDFADSYHNWGEFRDACARLSAAEWGMRSVPPGAGWEARQRRQRRH